VPQTQLSIIALDRRGAVEAPVLQVDYLKKFQKVRETGALASARAGMLIDQLRGGYKGEDFQTLKAHAVYTTGLFVRNLLGAQDPDALEVDRALHTIGIKAGALKQAPATTELSLLIDTDVAATRIQAEREFRGLIQRHALGATHLKPYIDELLENLTVTGFQPVDDYREPHLGSLWPVFTIEPAISTPPPIWFTNRPTPQPPSPYIIPYNRYIQFGEDHAEVDDWHPWYIVDHGTGEKTPILNPGTEICLGRMEEYGTYDLDELRRLKETNDRYAHVLSEGGFEESIRQGEDVAKHMIEFAHKRERIGRRIITRVGRTLANTGSRENFLTALRGQQNKK
jgi:hypothetical protein